MKFRIYLSALIIGTLLLTGCIPSFDSTGYAASMMDTLYKGDYTDYARFTGISTAAASQYRDQWLLRSADQLIAAFGSGTPSDEMRNRIAELLKKIYGNVKYEIKDGEDTSSVCMMIWPIDLIAGNYEALQSYVTDFNAKNDTFAFAALSEQEYYDTYLEGIAVILESHLTDFGYGDPVELDIAISQDKDGRYTIDSESLHRIQQTILQWPDA